MPVREFLPEIPSALLPLLVLTPVLLLVMINDLRQLRITNATTIAAFAIFLGSAVIDLPADLMARLAAAFAVFVLGFAAFALRAIGGGDVKFLSVLVLFIPFKTLVLFLNILSVSLVLGVMTIILLRKLPVRPGHAWTGIWGSDRFPMGLSIGLAGLIHPWLVTALLLGK